MVTPYVSLYQGRQSRCEREVVCTDRMPRLRNVRAAWSESRVTDSRNFLESSCIHVELSKSGSLGIRVQFIPFSASTWENISLIPEKQTASREFQMFNSIWSGLHITTLIYRFEHTDMSRATSLYYISPSYNSVLSTREQHTWPWKTYPIYAIAERRNWSTWRSAHATIGSIVDENHHQWTVHSWICHFELGLGLQHRVHMYYRYLELREYADAHQHTAVQNQSASDTGLAVLQSPAESENKYVTLHHTVILPTSKC